MTLTGKKDVSLLTPVTVRVRTEADPSAPLIEWRGNAASPEDAFRAVAIAANGGEATAPHQPFEFSAPRQLVLDFIIDGTGVIADTPDVSQEIEAFETVAFTYREHIHRTNLLDVIWEGQVFRSHLRSLNVEDLLFSPDGKPLRAKLGTIFESYSEQISLDQPRRIRSVGLTRKKRVARRDLSK